MIANIKDIIREKPHLEDPLRFYLKVRTFIESVRDLPIKPGPDEKAYRPDIVGRVFDLFSQVIDLPPGALDPLKRAMEPREIDFTRLPLGEIPAFSLPYAEDDLSMILFLLSKPWFLALRDTRAPARTAWEEGKCPLCKGQPSVTWIGEGREQTTECSYCGTIGSIVSAGCPVCLKIETSQQKKLLFEGEEGFTIMTCDVCRSYTKMVDADMIAGSSAEIADLASLPLDILVQEKGYMRRSPNPIGMTKITTRG